MAEPFVPGELWEMIDALLPAPRPRRFPHPGPKAMQAQSGCQRFSLRWGG